MKTKYLIALSLLVPCAAHADGWLATAGTSASLDFQSSGGASSYNVQAGIGHGLGSSFELLVLASYFNASIAGASSSVTEVLGQLDFVIAGDSSHAFYLGARGGTDLISDTSGNSSSATVYGGVIGKRFLLGGAVSYDPNVSVLFTSNSTGTSSPRFHIVPIQFTLVF